MSGSANTAVLYRQAEGVGWITLNRPDAANARNQQMRLELEDLYAHVVADETVRVVVLTAAGERHFCAGMDLKEASGPETQVEQRRRLRAGRDIETLAALPLPTIAAVNGTAAGGGAEMALACDLRVVAEGAKLVLPEASLGLAPGGGATVRLPRLVGLARAFELLYLSRPLVGQQIVDVGLATAAVPAADLADTAAALAGELAAKPPAGLAAVKELLRSSLDVPAASAAERELDQLLFLLQQRREAAASSPESKKGATS